jgi:hypothetical protein
MLVTDLDIERWVEQQYGFVPHPFWIAHCKELFHLTVEKPANPRKPWQECPPEKRLIIREAFPHFGRWRTSNGQRRVGTFRIDIGCLPHPGMLQDELV